MLTPLYTPKGDRPMKVAGFMSGSGTNLIKILEKQAALNETPAGSPFEVGLIFTDRPESKAASIAATYDVPFVVKDIMAFYRSQGHETKKDLSLRPEYDRQVLSMIEPYDVDTIVLAGYMSVVTQPLLEAFAGRIINVHPADLRILTMGKRKYTGDYAVRDAILAGEKVIRSSTHIVRQEVDGGEVLMVSSAVPVILPPDISYEDLGEPKSSADLNQIAGDHQERLKEAGDWVILPKTLERLARGRYEQDRHHQIYLDGQVLQGDKLEI